LQFLYDALLRKTHYDANFVNSWLRTAYKNQWCLLVNSLYKLFPQFNLRL